MIIMMIMIVMIIIDNNAHINAYICIYIYIYIYIHTHKSGTCQPEAFADLLRQPRYCGVTNVVSVGDSPFEWEAAKALEEVGDACVQIVKFKKMPSPTELCREQTCVYITTTVCLYSSLCATRNT